MHCVCCGFADINECDSNPCQNGGNCSNGHNMYTCSCADGFIGDSCETGLNGIRYTIHSVGWCEHDHNLACPCESEREREGGEREWRESGEKESEREGALYIYIYIYIYIYTHPPTHPNGWVGGGVSE